MGSGYEKSGTVKLSGGILGAVSPANDTPAEAAPAGVREPGAAHDAPAAPGRFVLEAGTVLGERYQLIRPLGEGGMGDVWSARHLATGCLVAVKAAKPGADNAVSRLRNEARALAAVSDPHVLTLRDVVDLKNGLYAIVIEYVDGKTLSALLKAADRLSLSDFACIMAQIASALSATHNVRLIHRDVKPDNIMVGCTAYGVHATLVDFGLAARAEEGCSGAAAAVSRRGELTEEGGFVGTPSYMPPEAVHGYVLPAMDMYALGVILYEFFAGTHPYGNTSGRQRLVRCLLGDLKSILDHCPEMPDWLAQAIMACIGPKEKRPTAQEMVKLCQRMGREAETLERQCRQRSDAAPVTLTPTLESAGGTPRQPRPRWLVPVTALVTIAVLLLLASPFGSRYFSGFFSKHAAPVASGSAASFRAPPVMSVSTTAAADATPTPTSTTTITAVASTAASASAPSATAAVSAAPSAKPTPAPSARPAAPFRNVARPRPAPAAPHRFFGDEN